MYAHGVTSRGVAVCVGEAHLRRDFFLTSRTVLPFVVTSHTVSRQSCQPWHIEDNGGGLLCATDRQRGVVNLYSFSGCTSRLVDLGRIYSTLVLVLNGVEGRARQDFREVFQKLEVPAGQFQIGGATLTSPCVVLLRATCVRQYFFLFVSRKEIHQPLKSMSSQI